MWISTVQATVFALVLTIAWALQFCDVSKMNRMDAAAQSGFSYPVLANDLGYAEDRVRVAYVTRYFTKNGELYLNTDIYTKKENADTCGVLESECKITDTACIFELSNITFYEVARDDKYLVTLSSGREKDTIVIGVRDFQKPVEIQDLPQDIRDKIEAACGSDAVRADFYKRKFIPGNFVPNCEKIRLFRF